MQSMVMVAPALLQHNLTSVREVASPSPALVAHGGWSPALLLLKTGKRALTALTVCGLRIVRGLLLEIQLS